MRDEGAVLSAGGDAVSLKRSSFERLWDRLLGVVIGFGVGPKDAMVLDVADRDSGRIQSTPIRRFHHDGRLFLVALRGRTQWVLNAERAGSAVLRKGYEETRYQLAAVSDRDRPELLKSFPVFELLAPSDARATRE